MSTPAVEPLKAAVWKALPPRPGASDGNAQPPPKPDRSHIRVNFDVLLLGKLLLEETLRGTSLGGLVKQARTLARRYGQNIEPLELTAEQWLTLERMAEDSEPPSEWPLAWDIAPGTVVERSELHRVYGGTPGPIAVCARTPNIFLFIKRTGDESALMPTWIDETLLVPGHPTDERYGIAQENQGLIGHINRGLPLRVFELRGSECLFIGGFAVDQGKPVDRVVRAGVRKIGLTTRDRLRRKPVIPVVEAPSGKEATRNQTVPVLRLHQLDGIRLFVGESDPFDSAPRLRLALRSTTELVAAAYRADPQLIRQLIADDEAARDVIAVAHRRRQIERFRRLLTDNDYFDEEVAMAGNHGAERVWQLFFEDNPWIFGVSLAGQLLTSWNDEKLEQVVTGASISGVGKRTDALLRTSGRIRSLVFAEIKTHRTELLSKEYRSGCWRPSAELSGGVMQAVSTVHLAVNTIGERLQSKTSDGSEVPGDYTYLLRPRSYLIIGRLDEFVGKNGGHHRDKIRSFELYRRNQADPEVLTFDELLARAEWSVTH
ncbi:Shedu immune nuclease family protein [Nocardia vulneris]|uniref:Shedu immune nuclease family protein n=1 Tax=Nocardia vulneris TaxID=1141657 RepID=UPI0030CACE1D